VIKQLSDSQAVLLLGFGVEGQGSYEFLRRRWPGKRLAIADEKKSLDQLDLSLAMVARLKADQALDIYLGGTYLSKIKEFDIIIKTAGVPASMPALREAECNGSVLSSHMEIFFELCPSSRIIGITGTKGKSTTTSLIHRVLVESGMSAVLAGNIGYPPLPLFEDASEASIFVCELSSHQLAPLKRSPHIAVFLNVVPEHLDYYRTFEEYFAAKENITRFQSTDDIFIYNSDYALPKAVADRTHARRVPFSMQGSLRDGCYLAGDTIVWSHSGNTQKILETSTVPLMGRFNLQNVLAASAAALSLGVEPSAIAAAVAKFTPLPHRIEYVGEYRSIRFYNDSISTVPEAAMGAIDALEGQVSTIILGGFDRHLDFAGLAEHISSSSVRLAILFPPTGQRIWEALRGCQTQPQAVFVETMEDAVQCAFEQTPAGSVCLLSPASPSFGTFKDFKARGEAFKRCVKEFNARQPGLTAKEK
jgi:UDP-N-acetylmuramoylalanine--D-glutamate ligase